MSSFALKLAVRELRGGLNGFRIFFVVPDVGSGCGCRCWIGARPQLKAGLSHKVLPCWVAMRL